MARRYSRDNRGRFSSAGATARGGRLATASGNKRATQTAKLSGGGPKGTVGKPKGLKPQSAKSLRTGVAVNRMRAINQKIGKGPDLAQVNVKGRFSGQAGKRMDASIDRAVKQVNAAQRPASSRSKPRVAVPVKPKPSRSQQSQRLSRAKQVEKRRGMNINNPAAWRQESAGRMAANAQRTQEKALAFYKNTGKAKKPAVGKIDDAKADRIIQRHDAMRPGLRPGTGSKAKAMNSINTFLRARKFLLEPSRKVAKKGETISGQESIRRAVAGASKKARNRK